MLLGILNNEPLLLVAGALTGSLCAAFTACNEPKDSNEWSEQRRIELAQLTDDVYYVAGSYSNMAFFYDDGTAKCSLYVFVSENLQDTVSVYNATNDLQPSTLFDGIFEFPAEIMPPAAACGIFFFPEEYRYSYPIIINSHRPLKKDESIEPPCLMMGPTSLIRTNKQIVVESLSKIK